MSARSLSGYFHGLPSSQKGNGSETEPASSTVQDFGCLAPFMVQEDALWAQIGMAKNRLETREVDLAEAGGDLVGSADLEEAQAGLLDVFDAEYKRITEMIKAQQDAQELSAKSLLSNIDAVVVNNPNVTLETVKSLHSRADDLAILGLQLQKFVKRNADILWDVAVKSEKDLGMPGVTYVLRRSFTKPPWTEGPNTSLVVVLSDIYEDLRKAENRINSKEDSNKDKKWVAPSSFERSTTKYWVKQDGLTELLLANASQAPLLVYGKSGHLTDKASISKTEGNKLWDELATPINSVYFDSPDMVMYKERIKRSEGAQLFRVRWYGKKPQGDEQVFLELKTHHEKWINDKSVKERVNIQERDMRKFLSSKNWNTDVAKKLVLAADPKLSGDKLDKQIDLICRMHDVVIKNNLRPCVRSMYVRAAFQSAESNALRLTLDRNVTLIDERQAPLGDWCLPDDAVLQAGGFARVPYPVFEIKLSDSEMPAIFQDLIDKGTLMEAPKFSKYLSGAAAFNADHISQLPYWASEPVFDAMFNASKNADHRPNNPHKVGAIARRTSVVPTIPKALTHGSLGIDDNVSTMFELDSIENESKGLGVIFDLDEAMEESMKKEEKEQIRQRPAAATMPSQKSGKSSGSNNSNSNKPISFAAFVPGIFKQSDEAKIAPKRRVRVEPKSYFANERTFIQWISAGLLLITVASILMEFGGNRSGNSYTIGIALTSIAIFVVMWATVTYFRRLKLLQSGDPYGYVDHFGPLILATAVLIGVIILLVYFVEEYRDDTQMKENLRQVLNVTAGYCIFHPSSSGAFSGLEFQPSGVLVDSATQQLLIPTLDHVAAMDNDVNPPISDKVESLIQIPGTDLEGITNVGDRIFVVSEAQQQPKLYELRRNSSALEEVADWDLEGLRNGGTVEGVTYVPSDNASGEDYLYVAWNDDPILYPENSGIVFKYDIPTSSDQDTLSSKGTLNRNLLSNGLSDSKIGDLVYYEGVLYLLHDNAKVIRSWDIGSGTLLAETALPSVIRPEGDFTNQWEGMAFEQTNTSRLLHMALDTPGEVWTFAVGENVDEYGNVIPGSIVFPPCAGAS